MANLKAMEKDKTSLERTILLATSVVGGIGGLFTAINGVSDSARKFFGLFAGLNEWQLGVAAVALAAVSLWLFRLSRRRRSVLLRPEALRLGRDNPAHLIGRVQDIAQLTRLCREQSLVFLEGESGTGKSALLQAGLAPALKGDSELLPIYVESLVGADWERDPRRFLAAALRTALDEAARSVLDLKAPPAPDAVGAALKAVPAKLGRMPLVILDQFDDYQARHRERFLTRKTWLKPGRLCEQNAFWRDLRELLVSGTIHLLVVTRTDTASGLTSVRFIEPETYRLDRLSSHFVGPVLTALAKEGGEQPVIGDPEYGWTALLARLAADIERAGTILPQQLKIVLAGLGTLPGRVLTIAAYERAGGAAGLEARFIEDRIARVAGLHEVTEEALRAALLSLVDTETGQKTIERRNDDLLTRIDPAVLERARRALDRLAQEEVIRRRVDPGTGESSWLLDHDYLARAVREANRRANRWQQALGEGAKALAEAGESWIRRWRALLPPRTQLAFFYDRLRGRFRYGGNGLYALNSLQRFAPYLGTLLLAVTLGLYEGQRRFEDRTRYSADVILNGLEFPQNNISESDAETVLSMASAEQPVRQLMLTLVLTDPDRARIFVRQPEMVMRAIVGVSPQYRRMAAAALASAAAASSSSRRETTMAIAEAALLLGRSEALPLAWWVAAIKGAASPIELGALGIGMGGFSTTLTESQADAVVEPFLAALKRSTDPYALRVLGVGLGAVPAKLTDTQAKDALEPFLSAIDAVASVLEGNPMAPSRYQNLELAANPLGMPAVLGEGLGALCAKLTDDQARNALGPLLASIKAGRDPATLGALGVALGSLRVKLTSEQAAEAVEPFLVAIQSATSPLAFQAFGTGLGALTAKLHDSWANDAIERIVAAIKSSKNPFGLPLLYKELRAASTRLSNGEAKDALEPLLAAIKRGMSATTLPDPGKGLEALASKPADKGARNPLKGLLAMATNPGALNLDPSQVNEMFKSLLGNFTSSDFSDAAQGLGANLTESEAREALAAFLAAIRNTTHHGPLAALAFGLGALSSKLDPASAKAAAVVANEVLEKTRDGQTFAIFAELSVGLLRHESRDQQVTGIFAVLRHPLAVGEPTRHLLALLQDVPGVRERFRGDLWKAVEWAEAEHKAGRLKGLDLDASLQIQ